MAFNPAILWVAQRIAEESYEQPVCAGAECACEEEKRVVAGELDVGLKEGRYAGRRVHVVLGGEKL